MAVILLGSKARPCRDNMLEQCTFNIQEMTFEGVEAEKRSTTLVEDLGKLENMLGEGFQLSGGLGSTKVIKVIQKKSKVSQQQISKDGYDDALKGGWSVQ